MNTSDKGPKWISGELRRKGVDARYIEEALEAFSQDQQVEKAAALMEKMLKKYKNDSVTVAKQKIEQNLMRKGYTGSIMKLAWETVDNQRDDDEAWQAVYHQALKAHRKLSTEV
ncbi:RecX family transcriptional regulator [Rossellomorea sp. H39__3]